jgi:hypothetical protein
MNLNPDGVHATWTHTAAVWVIYLPIIFAFYLWIGLILRSSIKFPMFYHGVDGGRCLWSTRNILMCTLVVPAEILLIQSILCLATVVAMIENICSVHKN